MNRGPVAGIDLSALKHNLSILRQYVNNRQIIAVVKADAYGHGAVEVARALLESGVQMLAVAFTGEARALRSAKISAPILVLFDRYDSGDYFEYGLTPVVQDFGTAQMLSQEAAARGETLPLHIKIDTGMGRIGFSTESAVSAIMNISGMKGLKVAGLMSHFSEADLAERSYADRQIAAFKKVRDEVSARLASPLLCHMANSAAALSIKEAAFDAVRPGLLLYGYSSGISDPGLKPVMSVRTRLLAVRSMDSGAPVSYGRTFVTARPSRIGVIPIGYADGYSRLFSNKAEMLLRGRRVRVAGRVCMDLTMVDVTDVEGAAEGDEVVILGSQGAESITASELAGLAGTIPYEVLTSLGSRAQREYLS